MASTDLLFRLAALNGDYASCLDGDRLEAWPEFFGERCLYKLTSADNHRRGYAAGIIYADSQAMLRDRVAALREANIFERHAYRHILGLPTVRAEQEGRVAAETSFLVARTMRDGRMDLFASGLYLDQVEDEGGRFRFAERVVVRDSSRFDTLVAIPL